MPYLVKSLGGVLFFCECHVSLVKVFDNRIIELVDLKRKALGHISTEKQIAKFREEMNEIVNFNIFLSRFNN